MAYRARHSADKPLRWRVMGYDTFARERYLIGKFSSEVQAEQERQRQWLATAQDEASRDEVWIIPPSTPDRADGFGHRPCALGGCTVENRVRYRKTAVIVLWSLLTGPVGATYKCLEEGGRVFYQDAPCPPHTQGGELNQNVNRTFSGSAPPPAFNAPNAPCCAADSTPDTPLRKEDANNKQGVAPDPP